jgi:peptidylprolyl isomerase
MIARNTVLSLMLGFVAATALAVSPPALAQSTTPTPVARVKPVARPTPPAAVAAAPADPAADSAESGGDVVARMGDSVIREDDLIRFVAGLGAADRAALGRDPEAAARVARALVVDRQALDEALAKHWEQQPAIAAELERQREATIVQTYLAALSAPPPDYPSDAELQSAYDANKSALLAPRQFLVDQIFVALARNADKAAADKAAARIADIARRLKEPDADFATIARSDSDARQTAERGGEIGWLAETQLRPEIKASVAALQKGAVSDPIRLDDGWQIVRLADLKPAYTPSFAEVRELLRQRLREEKAAANRRAVLADRLKQNPPAINELVLRKALAEQLEAKAK